MTTSGFFQGYLPQPEVPALAWSATAGKRRLRPGTEYDALFPRADMQHTQVKSGAKLEDTIRLIPHVVMHYRADTARLAEVVRGRSQEETLSNLWHFCYQHINYERDREGTEELRRPARSWADRASGVDCDCYSIFLSSTLLNLGIPHSYRITKYGGRPQFQHIYVIVPDASRRGSRKYWVLDPVLDQFDTEKPFSEHKDIPLNMNLEILSGFGEEDMPLLGLEGEPELEILLGLPAEPNDHDLLQHLKATRALVARNPNAVAQSLHPRNMIEMLDHAIQNWNSLGREAVLDKLAQVESQLQAKRTQQLNGTAGSLEEYMDGLYGAEDDSVSGYLYGESDDEELGFFKKVRRALKRVGKAVGKGVSAAGRAVGRAAKAVGKAIMRFNPLTIAIRNGLLLALRMNVGKMASKLKYGYLSEDQAKAKGFDMAEWQKLVKTREKWEGRFERMGGKKGNFKAAILKGKAGGLDGTLGELAEPIAELGESYGPNGEWQLGAAPAAAVGVAAPVIKAVLASLKAVSFKKLLGQQALKLVTNKLMNNNGGGGEAAPAPEPTLPPDDSWMMEEADEAAASEADANPPEELPQDETAPVEEAPEEPAVAETPEESPMAGWRQGRLPEPLDTDDLGAELGFAFFRRLKDKVKGLLQKPAGGNGGGGIFSRLRARRQQSAGSPIRQWATGTRPAARPKGQGRPFRLPTPPAPAPVPTAPTGPIPQPTIQPYADPMSTNLPAVIPAATTTPVVTQPANAPRRNLFQRLGDWFRDPKISTASKVAMGAGAVLATGALVVGAQSLLGVEDGLSGLFTKKKRRSSSSRSQHLNGTQPRTGKWGHKKNAGKGGKKKHKNRSKPYHGKGYIPTVKLK